MKNLILFILSASFCSVFAQSQQYEFIGTLETNTHQIISLKLNFEVDEKDSISGISIMDYYGENHTISLINGHYDVEKQKISFKELGNKETKSSAEAQNFCFVEVNDLFLQDKYAKSMITGDFTGYYSTGEICASGKIFLFGAQVLENEELPTSKVLIEVEKESSEKKETAKDSSTQFQRVRKQLNNSSSALTHQQILEIPWNGGMIKLKYWDSYKEDQDKINVYVNGKLLHKSLLVKAMKQTLNIPFEGKVCTIRIEAENEGTSPPNTVNVHLIDNGTVHPLITKLRKKQFVDVEIRKVSQ